MGRCHHRGLLHRLAVGNQEVRHERERLKLGRAPSFLIYEGIDKSLGLVILIESVAIALETRRMLATPRLN